MRTAERKVQTAFRLSPSLISRLKRQAEREHKSLNAFVETTLEKSVEIEWPKLPKDFPVSKEILNLRCGIKWVEPTKEELEADPKLARILGYAYED